ncbi:MULTISPECIES: SDR family NAD(P)-dependent oxidoreductase [unclassified Pseudofrankia]|uniref:SDR family NAD(P)-dependent oxidoreductase n=1 Tax=unclassified Pseudofrankia TaxID=2994372 RepID=UPI0008D92940|nr:MULTISPECIES: SDR family oxidoreductase [unclassified Pseudofrankia]MDT3444918.1 SDR family oxidoreductase [Pseudofrankia sp. BMG5.37]OHV64827.1 oxidoreductase [Pseudofrankia sp. BMG5.36]
MNGTNVPPASQPWSNKTVVITGGTSGTGFRAAQRFLDRGANVVVNGRSPERGQAALDALREHSSRVALSIADCADHTQASRLVEESAAAFGGIDVLVSAGASGKGDPKPFADMSPDEVRDGVMTRFLARMYPVHAAIPLLRARPGSCVVMLTTDAARHATTGETMIGAYAAGIIQTTKTLARELSRDQVRVNAVAMTLTAGTRSWDRIFATESFEKHLFEKAISRFPFGKAPDADDVANAIVFLASPEAAQITGQTVSVNGGLSFGGW